MRTTAEKITNLRNKLQGPDPKYSIMIIGLGSVGAYLLDYLVSKADPRMQIIIAGRNADKITSDVNIIKTAATIRGQYRCKIDIDSTCDLEDVNSIAHAIESWQPDFIVNTSRAYPGLKYGSISWPNFRAYGIWTPLSIKFALNIMLAYAKSNSDAITINTSYSDAVIPWLKSSGMPFFDFGSGNLNHLIPRMKFHIAHKFAIDNLNDIDITLAVSHFHDVVISKEGHSEGQDLLVDIRYKGSSLDIDKSELFSACKIPMPVDQKRNMMNASSNYAIINGIIEAIDNNSKVKIHSPGYDGEIGGYPVAIDCSGPIVSSAIDTSVFSLEQMREANSRSIYLDGIKDISGGLLYYTPELIDKVKAKFNFVLPDSISINSLGDVNDILISKVIMG